MATRHFWKGYLKFSLVTCPVTMLPATTESAKLRFHILNRKTGNRVESRYVDAVTGKALREADEAKGYPRGEDEFVLLEDEELEAVALESTRTIDIERFVAADSIGWVWFDKPHFLLPDGKVGQEAYAVIRAAMEASGTVGISRLVMYRRERAVMLQPRGKGIVLWTLRYGDEVRDAAAYFEGLAKGKPDARLLKLVKALIEERTQPWDPAMLEDPVQNRLRDIIAAKGKGRKRVAGAKPEPAAEAPSNVIDIMEALRRSLEKPGKRR